jgi:hypothetical protein
VIVSTCLCGNVLLGFLLRWHRELFFGWNTVGANVGGLPENSDDSPNTRESSQHVQVQSESAKRL